MSFVDSIVIGSILFSISITYATYRFKTNGSGSIENASWDVSLIGNEDDIELISGNNEQAYLITVNNNSEVDITYSITITDLPDNVEVKLDNGEYIVEDAPNYYLSFTRPSEI